jgi:hypothetical protein
MGFMKYAFEMGLGAMIYIRSLIKIGSNADGGDSHTNINTDSTVTS